MPLDDLNRCHGPCTRGHCPTPEACELEESKRAQDEIKLVERLVWLAAGMALTTLLWVLSK